MPRKPAKKAAWGGRIGGWCLDKRVPVRGRKLYILLPFTVFVNECLDKRVPVRGRKLQICFAISIDICLDKRVPVRGRKQEKEETETKEQETV